jgi:hypothetical protein
MSNNTSMSTTAVSDPPATELTRLIGATLTTLFTAFAVTANILLLIVFIRVGFGV